MLKRTRFGILQAGLLSLLLNGVLLAAPPAAQTSETLAPAKTVRLLTIGNSFSRNATRYLNDLAEAGGQELVHHPIYVGGASMQLHADKALLHAKHPDKQEGRYADGSTLQQRLVEQPWDMITIQQASRISHDESTYHPYAFQLRDLVRKHAPQARLMVHETWAYREDDPRFTRPSGNPEEPATHVEMHRQLRAAYLNIAKELEAGVIPVGDAFHLATKDPRWGFRPDREFDFAAAQFPNSPDQRYSLHVGWRWSMNKDGSLKLGMDGHHANKAGEFLGSAVFYEVLFEADVTKNPFLPPDFDPEFAQFLKDTAHRAVAQSRTSH